MDIIVPVFLGLLFIAFFVFMWYASKTWKWFDLVLLTFAFFLAIGLLPLAAGVMRVRSDWEKVRTEYASRVEKAAIEKEKIKYGEGPGTLAFVPLDVEVRQIRSDIGRAWRGLRFLSAGGDLANAGADAKVVLSMPAGAAAPADPAAAPVDPAADPAAAAPPATTSKINAEAIVYVFAEGDYAGRTTPQFYLGGFKVTDIAGEQVTLQPLLRMQPAAVNALKGGQVTTVSVFERMPTDSHTAFLAAGAERSDEYLFGRPDEALIRELLEGKVPPERLQSFLNDGMRVPENDPSTDKWVKVKFTKKYEIDVDSPGRRAATDGNYFDEKGLAVDSRLQRTGEDQGKAVVFEVGSEYFFSWEAYQELKALEIVTLIDTYYVRPLTDYRFAIFDIMFQIDVSLESTKILQRDRDVLQAAVDKKIEIRTREQEVKAKLELDIKQTVKEKEAIAKYLAKLESELATARSQVKGYYDQNVIMANQLEAIQTKLTTIIDARAASAVR